ncbi:hypothetical protein E2562_014566 [Oryza meyeriana var. granulata]|uniref:Uncharacterized protein n=1 Tax=Oryza meyeriana var. granulata TaxID=110450 RepID=A0A6G1EJ44_9ORYZ|nr:hypothetical protein E2562_014566 [Oryza meyeriana var. granulata]
MGSSNISSEVKEEAATAVDSECHGVEYISSEVMEEAAAAPESECYIVQEYVEESDKVRCRILQVTVEDLVEAVDVVHSLLHLVSTKVSIFKFDKQQLGLQFDATNHASSVCRLVL